MSDVRHPWRGLLLATVICVAAGVFIFANYFYDAFPEASVRFDLPKGEAIEKATEFLREQGEDAAGTYHRSIVFSMDRMASNYLEREVGLERANRLTLSPSGFGICVFSSRCRSLNMSSTTRPVAD